MTDEPRPSEPSTGRSDAADAAVPAREAGPAREAIATASLLAIFLFGGMAIGLAIALTVGGGSPGAIAVGFLALPLAFGLGMVAWRAILGVWLVAILGRAALRSRGDEGRFRAETRASMEEIRTDGPATLPGTWALLVVAILTGVVAAMLMVVFAEGDRLGAAALILAASIGYGLVLRRLARQGRLPIPEE
jgi:hypothetical protein